MASDLENVLNGLKNSVESSVQNDIDHLKAEVTAPVTGLLSQAKSTVAQANQAAASAVNISAFVDKIKANIWYIGAGFVILVVLIMKSKKGRK